jgi:hypothetical protein
MKTNDKNDFSKRTSKSVEAILKMKVENLGDNRTFLLNSNSFVDRVKIKQLGFILTRQNNEDKNIIFKAF